MNKEYLGDSVYVEIEDGMIKLTTDNGVRVSNEIFLEPQVVRALKEYIKSRDGSASNPTNTMTLEQYLKANCERQVIDHAIRADIGNDGNPRFYIHPALR